MPASFFLLDPFAFLRCFEDQVGPGPATHQREFVIGWRIRRIFNFCECDTQIVADFFTFSAIECKCDTKDTGRLAVFALFHQNNAQIVPGGGKFAVFFGGTAQQAFGLPQTPLNNDP